MYLFDTCALSELVAPKRNLHAVDAILAIPANEWFLAAVSVGEIKRGIEESKQGHRREFLESWFEEHVVGLYKHKIIVFDFEEATAWGSLVATLRHKHHPMSVADSQIAATALVHGLTVLTRNESDFAPSGVRVFNPWKS
jgi:tRNA(fMet)-specific endonuclease VapC